MPSNAEDLVEKLAAKNPWAVRLAEIVSLAVRIEPELLRTARLRLLPLADAGSEADLWFSGLVQSRNPAAMVLRKDVAELLSTRLASRSEELDGAWAVIETAHRQISSAIFAEEKLTWLALSRRDAEMKDLLRSIIATMLQPQRSGLLSWATRALPLLPAAARESEEGQMLAFGVSIRLDDPMGFEVSSGGLERMSQWATWMTPGDVPTALFGVRMVQGAVEFGSPTMSGSHKIELPKTRPMLVELSWQQGKRKRHERIRLQADSLTFVDTAPMIYISCQPEDAANHTEEITLLREGIVKYFGEQNIVERLVESADTLDAEEEIMIRVSSCDVMLVLVGPAWLRTNGSKSLWSLPGPFDLVRRELDAARHADLPIIPIYLGNTRAPELDDLPVELLEFSRSLSVLYTRLPDHLRRLVQELHSEIEMRTVVGHFYRLLPVFPEAEMPFRVKAPKVSITYDLEIGDKLVRRELPFVVGVLADLSSENSHEALPPLSERRFIEIDRYNFDTVMAATRSRLTLNVAEESAQQLNETNRHVELAFQSIQDFYPTEVANQVAPLKELLARRRKLIEMGEILENNQVLSDVLAKVFMDPQRFRAEVSEPAGRDFVAEILRQAGLEPVESLINSVRDLLQFLGETKERIDHDPIRFVLNQVDQLLSAQLREICHHQDFQKLEATWRGLSYLVNQTDTSELLKIKVLNVSKKELMEDVLRAPSFAESSIFRKVYTESYGFFDQEPFGVIIGDYEFSNHSQDLALLEKMSEIAATAHVPFISAASPAMFNIESFTELSNLRDMAKIFQGVEYTKWKSFRDSGDSRYVALCLPRTLMRLPYGQATVPVETFDFEEGVDGTDHGKYLWGNTAFVLGTRITDAFAKYGWTAAIRGVEGGGLVEGLPVQTFKTDEGEVALNCPTEIAITDRCEKELADLGFISLVHCKATDYAAFFSTRTVNKPMVYDTDAANANARLASQLQYILAVCRFAHYLKSIMRDKIGSFMTRKNVEDYLNSWISNYVILDDDAEPEMRARYPLRDARIDVADIPGKPGAYRAMAFLQPHYQLDELTIALRLAVNLSPPAR